MLFRFYFFFKLLVTKLIRTNSGKMMSKEEGMMASTHNQGDHAWLVGIIWANTVHKVGKKEALWPCWDCFQWQKTWLIYITSSFMLIRLPDYCISLFVCVKQKWKAQNNIYEIIKKKLSFLEWEWKQTKAGHYISTKNRKLFICLKKRPYTFLNCFFQRKSTQAFFSLFQKLLERGKKLLVILI